MADHRLATYSRPIEELGENCMFGSHLQHRLDSKPLQVGDLEIIPIYDGVFSIPTPPQLKGEDQPDFELHRSYVPGDGMFYSELGAFLVRTGNRIVLLDAGLGPACGHGGVYC